MTATALIDEENLALQTALLCETATLVTVARHLDIARSLRFAPDDSRSQRFACALIPGARAWFARGGDGRFVYATQGDGCPPEFLSLGRFYGRLLARRAGMASDGDGGDGEGLRRVARGVLATRLLADTGLIRVPGVTMEPPPGAGASERAFVEQVALLFACRFWMYDGCPLPLSQALVGMWAGVSATTAYRGVARLSDVKADARAIWKVYTLPNPPPMRGTRLYLPIGCVPPDGWLSLYGGAVRRARITRLDRAING